MARQLLALFLGVIPLAAAFSSTVYWGGTQFILYNGTLKGTLTYTPTDTTTCGRPFNQTFDNLNPTYLLIGVNPPEWDPNPFYFSLLHGDEFMTSSPFDNEIGPYFIQLESSYFSCYKDGRPCNPLIEVAPWEFVTAQKLDLKRADVKVEKDRDGLSGPFYKVSGGEKTWVGDEKTSPRPGVNYTTGGEQSLNCTSCMSRKKECVMMDSFVEDGEVQVWDFAWGVATSFRYTLSFTNDAAVVELELVDGFAALNMRFEGEREEPDGIVDEGRDVLGQEYHAVRLLSPEGNATPKFTYTNGTEITWQRDSLKTWNAVKTSDAGRLGGGAVGLALVALVFVVLA